MYDLIEQYRIRDEMLSERLNHVLPAVMKETGTECWLIASREYNEDPMFPFIVPSLYPHARRLTILIFALQNDQLQRISVSFPDANLDRFYEHDFDRTKETQFEALERVLRKLNPGTIHLNMSDHYAYTDGLSYGLYRTLMRELSEDLTCRFVSDDQPGIRFLETRTETELKYYPEVMREALTIIEDAFASIVPGKTTCRDVMDHMAREVNRRGIVTWFNPDIDLQNETGMHGEDTVIRKGDLVHCDFGIVYLGLCTDTQRLCYVLKDGETDAPQELKEALKRNNRFQDIVCEQLKAGRTGNEVFLSSIARGKQEGLRPVLYTHPLGLFGHACGPTIGLWTDQNPIYPAGENTVHDRTAYALELSIIEYLDLYRRDIYIFTEESVVLADNEVRFLCEGRDRLFIAGGKE